MSIVEMQPSVHTSFAVSDTRPSLKTTYLDHVHPGPQYAESRHSSKENKTPPPQDIERSPASTRSFDEVASIHNGPYQLSPPIAGKKRSADGELREKARDVSEPNKTMKLGHSRNTSTISNASNATMTEVGFALNCQHGADGVQLGQQLRTRLTYAMVKVQNGWQNRSLDEVESLASASPRSTTFNHYSSNQYLLSPRVAMTATLNREQSDSSSESDHIRPAPNLMSPPPARRGLAPPANIVARPGQRRRPTPNIHTNTLKPLSPPRPAIKQRTPSQNAAMEADAVETLLFMASPNHSNNSNNRQFSPVTSVPSVGYQPQTSPLRNTFSAPTSPRKVTFTDHMYSHGSAKKAAIIDAMMEKLDADGSAELDEALKLMDRHHATKVIG